MNRSKWFRFNTCNSSCVVKYRFAFSWRLYFLRRPMTKRHVLELSHSETLWPFVMCHCWGCFGLRRHDQERPGILKKVERSSTWVHDQPPLTSIGICAHAFKPTMNLHYIAQASNILPHDRIMSQSFILASNWNVYVYYKWNGKHLQLVYSFCISWQHAALIHDSYCKSMKWI